MILGYIWEVAYKCTRYFSYQSMEKRILCDQIKVLKVVERLFFFYLCILHNIITKGDLKLDKYI